MPAEQEFIGQQSNTRGFHDRLGGPHCVAMIGNHQKIERARQLRLCAFGGGNFFATGKSQRRFGVQPIAKAKRINAVVGVEMGVAPEHLLGIFGVRDLCAAFIAVIILRAGRYSQGSHTGRPHQ